MENKVDANGNVVGSPEWEAHRKQHEIRKKYWRALKNRREYLDEKIEMQGITNSYMVNERDALDYVLSKFKDHTL